MKFKIALLLVLSGALLAASRPVFAHPLQDDAQALSQPSLCLPDQNRQPTNNCEAFGPISYFSSQAQEGILFPLQPLPAKNIDAAYTELPFNYVHLSNDEVPIFSSLDDAIKNVNPYRYISAGRTKYATYIDSYQGNGRARFYMIEPGMWIRGGSTTGRIATPTFVGMQFAGTPDHRFGWIILTTESYTQPGGEDAYRTGKPLNKFDPIQVYRTENVNGVDWYLIGPDEWVDSTNAALVYPTDQAPNGVTNGRWIEVNLYEQTIAVYQDNRLIFATLTSTGISGWWTRPGLFQITEKLSSTPMTGSFEADRSDYYYLEDVPWTMYFDQSRALHGAYWHNLFGYEQSHGCVNMSPGDARWLFTWANVGDYVYVWDPSGQTPTDPSLYTAGGA